MTGVAAAIAELPEDRAHAMDLATRLGNLQVPAEGDAEESDEEEGP
jgi:hypothetical protein